jgi:hypothetical protein
MYLYLTKMTNYKVQVLKVGYVDKHVSSWNAENAKKKEKKELEY